MFILPYQSFLFVGYAGNSQKKFTQEVRMSVWQILRGTLLLLGSFFRRLPFANGTFISNGCTFEVRWAPSGLFQLNTVKGGCSTFTEWKSIYKIVLHGAIRCQHVESIGRNKEDAMRSPVHNSCLSESAHDRGNNGERKFLSRPAPFFAPLPQNFPSASAVSCGFRSPV